MDSKPPALTIIGDVGVDLVLGPIQNWPRIGTETLLEKSELRAGGSAGNSALAVHYLGGQSGLLSLVGNDDFGVWLGEQFRGLKTSLPVCDAPTSVSVGFIHACGERTFFTTRGHLEKLAYAHVRPRLGSASDTNSIVMLSGVFLTPEIRRSYDLLIDDIARLGYRVALDTGWPPGNWSDHTRHEVSRWIAKCDHVLLNELEVASLAGRDDLESAARDVSMLMKPGASLVVKTGARGALGLQAGRSCESSAGNVAVFDTIGAGDSFNAGYLLARLNGCDLSDALAAGCSAATSIISRFPRRNIRHGELAAAIGFAGARLCAQQ